MTLLEPDVALTDFGLALECGMFARFLPRGSPAPLHLGFLAFFVALAVAALLGGITHGFLPASGAAQDLVWTATLLAIGAASCASWAIGAGAVFSQRVANTVTLLGAALFAVYLFVVLFVSRSYVVAIAHYLPAAVFLLAAFAVAYRREPTAYLAGVALTIAAAGLQQAGIDLHPVYFNHNALYHLVQAVALALLFASARGLLNGRATCGSRRPA